MEQTKYLEPKLSFSFDDLAGLLRSTGNLSDSTRMSCISAADRINVKRKNYKSLPISPKGNKAKNCSQQLKLKYIAASDLAISTNPNSTYQFDEMRKVTSTKRERMPELIPKIKNMKKVKHHHNSYIAQDSGFEFKKSTHKKIYIRPQAKTSLGNKPIYLKGQQNKRYFINTRGSQKTVVSDTNSLK